MASRQTQRSASPASASEELTGKPDTVHSPLPSRVEEDDIPDVFTVPDDAIDLGGTPHGDPLAFSLEDLNAPIDAEGLQKAYAEGFLPSGDYLWRGVREASCTHAEGDKRPGDCSPEGRRFIHIWGKVESKDGLHSGEYRASLSPDLRFRKDEKGKDSKTFDMFSEPWKKAFDLFFTVFERNPATQGELVGYLLKGDYLMYVTQSKRGGNFLNGFKRGM